NDGCLTARRLFREIQKQGYTGSYNTVAQYTQRLRQAQGLPPRHRTPRQPRPAVVEPQTPALTPRGATWLILKRQEKREADDHQQIAQLQGQHDELAKAIDLAQDFAELVRRRQPERLDAWLERAAQSTVKAFARFASGLREDYEAVKA